MTKRNKDLDINIDWEFNHPRQLLHNVRSKAQSHR